MKTGLAAAWAGLFLFGIHGAWGLPDLVIDDIWSSPTPLTEGKSYTFHARVRNQGDETAGAGPAFNQWVHFFVDGLRVGRASYDNVPPGGWVSVSVNATAPAGGWHPFSAVADATSRIAESNEDNNGHEQSLVVLPAPLPDLVVTELWVSPTNPVSGQSLTLHARIMNQGTDSTWMSKGFDNALVIAGADMGIERYSSTAIATGESVTVSHAFTAPAPGDYTISAIADYSREITELDEANNLRSGSLAVQPAVYLLSVETSPTGLQAQVTSSTGHEGVTPYSKQVTQGTTVSLTAAEYLAAGAARMRFDGWTVPGTAVITVVPPPVTVDFEMDEAKTCTARYVPDPETVSPANGQVVDSRRPTFTWPAIEGATWYYLWINLNGKTYHKEWLQGVTTWTPDWDFPSGGYEWWIQPWGETIGYGAWSQPPADFVILSRTPGAIAQIGPQGAQTGYDLIYRWTKDPNATWYELWVGCDEAGQWQTCHDQWYEMAGTGEASLELTEHPAGNFNWWIRGWGPDGYGPWSGPMDFSTPSADPAKPVLTAPTGRIRTSRPIFNWLAAQRAEWYRVWVQAGSTPVIDEWTQNTSLLSPVTLSSGDHSWWVGSWNDATRQTVWSDEAVFQAP